MSMLAFMSMLKKRAGSSPGGGGGGVAVPSVSGKVIDTGLPNEYHGFPQLARLSNGQLGSMYKKAGSHADTGPLMLSKGGGVSWSHSQVTISGVGIECSALVMSVLSTGRILVVYQDNDGGDIETYTFIKICYSDDNGTTWHQGDQYDFTNGLYISSILGRPLELPSGKVLIHYYQNGQAGSGLGSINGILETTDGGVTLTEGAIIRAKTGRYAGGGNDVFNQICSELGWCITHATGVDSTTKIVGLLRNEESSYFTFVKSSDGGATWSQDSTNFFLGFGGQGRFPVDIIMYGGFPRVVAGVRRYPAPENTFVGSLEMVTFDSADDLFSNHQTNYDLEVIPYTPASILLGSGEGLSWGYASCCIDNFGALVTNFYDKSDLSVGAGDDRHMVYQIVIQEPSAP